MTQDRNADQTGGGGGGQTSFFFANVDRKVRWESANVQRLAGENLNEACLVSSEFGKTDIGVWIGIRTYD